MTTTTTPTHTTGFLFFLISLCIMMFILFLLTVTSLPYFMALVRDREEKRQLQARRSERKARKSERKARRSERKARAHYQDVMVELQSEYRGRESPPNYRGYVVPPPGDDFYLSC